MNPADISPPVVAVGGTAATVILIISIAVWAIKFTVANLGPTLIDSLTKAHAIWAEKEARTETALRHTDAGQEIQINTLTATVAIISERIEALEAAIAKQTAEVTPPCS